MPQQRRCAVCGHWSWHYRLLLGWFVYCWRHESYAEGSRFQRGSKTA